MKSLTVTSGYSALFRGRPFENPISEGSIVQHMVRPQLIRAPSHIYRKNREILQRGIADHRCQSMKTWL